MVAAERTLLTEAGHAVATFMAANSPRPTKAAAQLAFSSWNPANARRVGQVAASFRPTVVHAHNTWFAMSPAALSAAADSGAAVLLTLHNYRLTCVNGLLFRDGRPCEDCVGTHPWHGVRHRCYRGSRAASAVAAASIQVHKYLRTWTRTVDLFLAPSQFTRSRLVRAGLPPSRVVLKPNFVSDPGGERVPPGDSRTVVFVGRLAREKGILTVLEAWRRMDRGRLELLVIGDGPLAADARASAHPSVRFAGRLPPQEVRDRLLSARALLFPSVWYEVAPVALLEGLAAGLPVLTSAVGSVGEVGRSLGEGWTAPPGDANSWARGMEALRHDGRVNEAGSRARSLYEREFSTARALDRLEQVYRTATEFKQAKVDDP